jgi:hypothetical protein
MSRAQVTRFVCIALATVGALRFSTARAEDKPDARPGMTYASIARLPDFGGWWYLDLDPNGGFQSLSVVFTAYAPLLKPELAKQFSAYLAAAQAGERPDPVDRGVRPEYCKPMVFSGFNGGFEDNIEFLFTPGRVTITSELGLLRRVYLYRPLPTDAEESSMGSSVGHWEGSTLVVETTGLDSNGILMTDFKIGRNAHIVERISLKGEDRLEIDRELVAPDVLTGPSKMKLLFRRDRDHIFHEASHCANDDRSIDPETHRQRFDLTPPADLPPPPR